MRKSIFTLTALLISLNNLIAQNHTNTKTDDLSSGLTASYQLEKNYEADSNRVSITIVEFETTDPVSQQTTKVTIDKIEEALKENLKSLGIDFNDCTLDQVYDSQSTGTVALTYNNYGNAYNNNNRTRKKLIGKVYSFYLRNTDKEEELYNSFKMNGFQYIGITYLYKSNTMSSIKKELNELCISRMKNKAIYLANSADLELGKVSGLTCNVQSLVSTQANYNYYNTQTANFFQKKNSFYVSGTIKYDIE